MPQDPDEFSRWTLEQWKAYDYLKRQEMHDRSNREPTEQEKADDARYWAENPELFRD